LCGYAIAANEGRRLPYQDGCYGFIVSLLQAAAMPLFVKAASAAGGCFLQVNHIKKE
jgi:hypothetical protein